MNDFLKRVYKQGFYGEFGGCFAPELLQPVLKKVQKVYEDFCQNESLQAEFRELLSTFAGRPTPLYQAKNFAKLVAPQSSAELWIKREDLLHGGAHKTNNVIGQALLAREMGCPHLIAETGAGQHGIATAMAGAHFGLSVKIFMGAKDVERQAHNVERMKLLGAEVVPVTSGSQSLKDAVNEAMRYWISHDEDTYYVFGTAAGPDPFPTLVTDFQQVIGEESRQQFLEITGELPHAVLACMGGGSNAIGIFSGFLSDEKVELIGVEPAGDGVRHGLTLSQGRLGCLHGSLAKVNCDDNGQIEESHSISAGLDYPGSSPIHSYLQSIGRVEYVGIDDETALKTFVDFARCEGIIPALESSHALAYAGKLLTTLDAGKKILVNLSGRGDKDLPTIFNWQNQSPN